MLSNQSFFRRTAAIAAVGMVAAFAVATPLTPAAADNWKHHHRHYQSRVVYRNYYYVPRYAQPRVVYRTYYTQPPVVYYPPAPTYVAPAPVYVAPPGINLTVPLR